MSIFAQNIEEAAGAQLVNPLSEFYQKYINTLSPRFKISSCTYDGTRLSIKLDKDNSRTLHLGDVHNMFRDCLPDIKILDAPSFAFVIHQGYLDGQHMTVNCKSFKFDGISLKNMCVVSDQAAGWVFLDCLNLENVKFQAKCLEIMPFDDGDDRSPQMFYFPGGKNVVVSDNCNIYMAAANSVTFLRTLRCMLDLESFPIPEECMDDLYAYTYIQKSFDAVAKNALPLNPGLRIMDALRLPRYLRNKPFYAVSYRDRMGELHSISIVHTSEFQRGRCNFIKPDSPKFGKRVCYLSIDQYYIVI